MQQDWTDSVFVRTQLKFVKVHCIQLLFMMDCFQTVRNYEMQGVAETCCDVAVIVMTSYVAMTTASLYSVAVTRDLYSSADWCVLVESYCYTVTNNDRIKYC